MRFFPYENFYIITRLTPDEVHAKLEEVVSPNGPMIFNFFSTSDGGLNTPFKGYVNNGQFEFKPNIIYRNSFLPQIKGSTEAYNDGSRIHIKMTLHVLLMIITGILLTVSGIAFLVSLPRLINNNAPDIIPCFVFMFVYLLATGAFKSESISSKSFLAALLEGEIE